MEHNRNIVKSYFEMLPLSLACRVEMNTIGHAKSATKDFHHAAQLIKHTNHLGACGHYAVKRGLLGQKAIAVGAGFDKPSCLQTRHSLGLQYRHMLWSR